MACQMQHGALQICSCLMEILRAGSIQCDSDLEGPSASIVVEKRLWNCSVCASVVGLHFFCIFLHLFAFICIFLHRIFCNLNLHFFPPSVVGSIPGTGVSGIGRQQPCFKGILSGNVAELSRPWRVTY